MIVEKLGLRKQSNPLFTILETTVNALIGNPQGEQFENTIVLLSMVEQSLYKAMTLAGLPDNTIDHEFINEIRAVKKNLKDQVELDQFVREL